jgi:hypothetical protein
MLRNHHISEIYKRDLLDADCPRRGDFAEIVRDHHRTETGLVVEVVNDPHWSEQYCAECGQKVVEMFVEVRSKAFAGTPGPHFYPLRWLKRIHATIPNRKIIAAV